jgi:hypothetical protein
MLWGVLAGSVAAVVLVQEVRRWLARHSDALPVMVLAALWWLIRSLMVLWRSSILFVIREVRSW